MIQPLTNPTGSLAAIADPLPSWQDSPVKAAIVAFVEQATRQGGPGYIPPGDRIATFDNDGTLWCEQPLAQGMFVLEKLKARQEANPLLSEQPVMVALLEGDKSYFAKPDAMTELVQILGALSGNTTQSAFDQEAMAFLANATHPQFDVLYSDLGYVPQIGW